MSTKFHAAHAISRRQCLAGAAAAAAAITLPATSALAARADLGDLTAALEGRPEGFDFAALRQAYSEAYWFDPFDAQPLMRVQQRAESVLRTRGAFWAWTALIKQADRYIGDLQIQNVISRIANDVGKTEEASYRKWIASGLSQSILRSGDGARPSTAFRIIAPFEQAHVFVQMGLKPVGRRLIRNDGQFLEQVQAVPVRRGRQQGFVILFDITSTIRRFGRWPTS